MNRAKAQAPSTTGEGIQAQLREAATRLQAASSGTVVAPGWSTWGCLGQLALGLGFQQLPRCGLPRNYVCHQADPRRSKALDVGRCITLATLGKSQCGTRMRTGAGDGSHPLCDRTRAPSLPGSRNSEPPPCCVGDHWINLWPTQQDASSRLWLPGKAGTPSRNDGTGMCSERHAPCKKMQDGRAATEAAALAPTNTAVRRQELCRKGL